MRRYDEEADRQAGRDPLGEAVDDVGEVRGERGEGGVPRLVEEGPDAVLDKGSPNSSTTRASCLRRSVLMVTDVGLCSVGWT